MHAPAQAAPVGSRGAPACIPTYLTYLDSSVKDACALPRQERRSACGMNLGLEIIKAKCASTQRAQQQVRVGACQISQIPRYIVSSSIASQTRTRAHTCTRTHTHTHPGKGAIITIIRVILEPASISQLPRTGPFQHAAARQHRHAENLRLVLGMKRSAFVYLGMCMWPRWRAAAAAKRAGQLRSARAQARACGPCRRHVDSSLLTQVSSQCSCHRPGQRQSRDLMGRSLNRHRCVNGRPALSTTCATAAPHQCGKGAGRNRHPARLEDAPAPIWHGLWGIAPSHRIEVPPPGPLGWAG